MLLQEQLCQPFGCSGEQFEECLLQHLLHASLLPAQALANGQDEGDFAGGGIASDGLGVQADGSKAL